MQNRAVATSLFKGLDVLTALARAPEGLTMPALRAKLRQPRTSLLRILTTLEAYGLIVREGAGWRTTERFHDWCRRDMYRDLRERHRPLLEAVAAEVGELVELGVAEGSGVRYIDWIEADHPITVDPRKSALYPLERTATGKLVLSQRPDLCAELRGRALLAEIAEAGRAGVAWNRRESDPNIVAVATWVGAASPLTPVLCVKWPFFRFTEAKATRALAVMRREVARNDWLPPKKRPEYGQQASTV